MLKHIYIRKRHFKNVALSRRCKDWITYILKQINKKMQITSLTPKGKEKKKAHSHPKMFSLIGYFESLVTMFMGALITT